MKVDKQKFLDALNYIKEVNDVKLEDLDLSEFFEQDRLFDMEHTLIVEGKPKDFVRHLTYAEILVEWDCIGLSNKELITTYMDDKV